MATIIEGARPAESQHWYRADGSPAYEIVGANGKTRATNLRDAKKLNLFYSVTGIIRLAASPSLDRYKQEQVLLAALTLPRLDDETEQDWLKRVMLDSQEHAKQAAEAGTNIHTAINLGMEGQPYDAQYRPHVTAVQELLQREYGDLPWRSEQSFAHPDGFGGKTDLHCGSIVLDFKGKDFGPDDEVKLYDEHPMQLAAYARGLGIQNPEGGIVFVSRNNPGVVKLVRCPPEDLARGWEMFSALLAYWKAKSNYQPAWTSSQAA